MLEILKIIILACQITPGVGGSIPEVHAYQVKCQKELIICAAGKEIGKDKVTAELYKCILDRKETL
jgi:hypothetical protein